MTHYSDFTALRTPFVLPTAGVEAQSLLSNTVDRGSIQLARQRRESSASCALRLLTVGTALLGLGGGVVLKVANYKMGWNTTRVDTVADLVMGVSLSALAQGALPTRAKVAIMNEIKRWSVPLFEIGTNIYLNVSQTHLARQLFFTPVNMATGALVFDDVVLLATMEENLQVDAPLSDKPLPMLEGDAKSFKRLLLNQGTLAAAGIGLIILGALSDGSKLKGNLLDGGISACSYALGVAVAQRIWAITEKLNKEWRAAEDPFSPSDPPLALRLLGASIKFFQMAYPQIFAFSIVSNHPVGYGLSAMVLGMGTQIQRTAYQYQRIQQVQEANSRSLWSRVKNKVSSIWNSRKRDIVLNGTFLGVMTGWLAFGETMAGIARIREGVAALYGATVASYFINALIDIGWKAGDSPLQNSLFFNTVALSPAAYAYLFMQTKLVANDVFLENATPFGYACGLAALVALGFAIGQDRWSEMREGRTEPALTPPLARSLGAWTTAKYYLGLLNQ